MVMYGFVLDTKAIGNPPIASDSKKAKVYMDSISYLPRYACNITIGHIDHFKHIYVTDYCQ